MTTIDLIEENEADPTPEVLAEEEPSRWRQAWPWLLAIFVLGLTVSCFPIQVSNDPWWHLKTGQVLIKFMDGPLPRFPEHDVFSVSGADKEWANHEWLADMVMYATYHIAGLRFLIFLKSLTFIAAFLLTFLYIWRRTGEFVIPGLIVLIAILTSQWTAYLRPPVFTYFFVAVTLNLLWSLERSKKSIPTGTIAALAGIMILWVNLHGGAILGIVITGLWFAGNCLNHLQERRLGGTTDAGALVRWIPALVVLFVASLVNPFTYDIHLLPFKVLGDEFVVRTNSELQPPDFRFVTSYIAYVAIAVAAFLAAGLRRWRRIRYADLLLVAFFLWQSMSHVRHLPLFAIVAAAPTCVWLQYAFRPRSLEDLSDLVSAPADVAETGPRLRRRAVANVLAVVFALVWIDTSLLTIPRPLTPNQRAAFESAGRPLPGFFERLGPGRFLRHVRFWATPEGYVAAEVMPDGQVYWNYPEAAVDFLLDAEKTLGVEFPGQMFNTINHSGYLIWRLAPEHHRVLTDSRFDIHGEEYLFDVLAVENALPVPREVLREREELRERADGGGEELEQINRRIEAAERGVITPYWQEILNQHDIGFILIEMDKPVVPLLFEPDSRWKPVYRDNSYAILVRDSPPNREFIAQLQDFFRRWRPPRVGP